MEVLFSNQQRLELDVQVKTIGDLILYLKENKLSEREELFVDGTNLYKCVHLFIVDVLVYLY